MWCRTNDGPGQSKEKLAKPLTASSPLLQKQTKDTVLTSGTSVAVKVFDTRRTITKDLFYHEVGVMMRLQDAKVADHAAAGDEPVGPSYAGNYIVDFFGYAPPKQKQSPSTKMSSRLSQVCFVLLALLPLNSQWLS